MTHQAKGKGHSILVQIQLAPRLTNNANVDAYIAFLLDTS
jgi:hypothetical protein